MTVSPDTAATDGSRAGPPAEPTDPGAHASARLAGLRYTSDETPGLTRRRQGRGFSYWTAEGRRVRERDTLARIRMMAIPPAWTDVWICPAANGHLQATGRDARRRKQYRYHARWRDVRDEVKYGRMVAFGAALPIVRRRTAAHIRNKALTRTTVLATIVQLLEKTLIRVGNDEYARTNHSFGLTTLRDRHVAVKGAALTFEFRGKSGVRQLIGLNHPRLARLVKRCQELPGQTLFQYLAEDGARQSVGSADVNDYLREITGQDFTAKDFRTWAGTVLAACALRELKPADTDTETKRNIVAAVERVAHRLGNTKAVCRKSYIHPAVIHAYVEGGTIDGMLQQGKRLTRRFSGLTHDEVAVLLLLERRLARETRARRGHSTRRAA